LSADDQVIVMDSEDAQQTSIQKLGRVTYKNGLKIQKAKRKQWPLKEEIQ
jgi:hypothetical protein